jgi:hypothetical protein
MVEWNVALAAEIDSEPDCDRLHRFRVRLRRRAHRPVFSLRVARGASQHGYKGCREAGIALIATMAALVLSLLIASAKSTYDTCRNQLLQVSVDIILLDRVLAHYGAETKEARAMLQRSLQNQASTIALDLGRTRVLIFEELGSSIPVPFLVVLVFWLCIIFAGFGLFAPRNTTVIATFFVCAMSVSGAIFLILELDRSFEGLLQVSSAPLRAALAQLGQ